MVPRFAMGGLKDNLKVFFKKWIKEYLLIYDEKYYKKIISSFMSLY